MSGVGEGVGEGVGLGVWVGVAVGGDDVRTGVGVGVPLGSGPSRIEGNTIVWFPLASAGPGPWRLYVKLAGVEPTTFPVGGPPSR